MPPKSPWKIAVQKAKQVEEEGSKDFADIIKSTKKRKLDDADVVSELETDNTDETETVKSSGYCQSMQLASFVKKIIVNGSVGKDEIETLKNEAVTTPDDTVSNGIDARQICRTWLKNHYLGIGSACKKDPCPRQHIITGNPQRLYSDFSFKGLPSKHQKVILDALKTKQ
jgi:hypothetical protein